MRVIKFFSVSHLLCLGFAFVFNFLPSSLSAQNNIHENPFQLEWLNQRIDDTSSDVANIMDFSVGHLMGDTLIQVSEIKNNNPIKVETYDPSGVLLQLCTRENGTLICDPDPDLIPLQEQRTFWMAGSAIACSLLDSMELVRHYWSLDGTQWEYDWDLNQPKSTWQNVVFHSNGCVRELQGARECNGRLLNYHFREIELLRFVLVADLGGELHDFRHMPKLESLTILATAVEGEIPNFSSLPKLKYLSITDCDLTGSIPNFEYLPKVERIDLEGNQLTGTIPFFEHCLALKDLDVAMNELEGTIPFFDNHVDLRGLTCYSNNLTGEIPNFNNAKLQQVSLHNNELTGTIPDFQNCPSLVGLYIHSNELTGTIPDFSSSPSLSRLHVYQNNLTGSIPSFEHVQLKFLNCADNYLSGPVPDFSISSPSFIYCDISRNSLTFEDIIPTVVANDTTCVSFFPGELDGYYYSLQRWIYKDTTFNINIGESLTIDLMIDDTVSTSVYKWFKNDTFYREIIGSNKLEFTNADSTDSGVYKVEITNPISPDLILRGYPITLVVEGTSSIASVTAPTLAFYPNPMSHHLTIETSSSFSPLDEILIFDSHGATVKKHLVTHRSTKINMDTSDFFPGMYLVSYRNGDSIINNLVVKL